VTDVGVGSGALLGRMARSQMTHFIVGQSSEFQSLARNRNVRLDLELTGRTRTHLSTLPAPIRTLEPPEPCAGVERFTLSAPIACEPEALI